MKQSRNAWKRLKKEFKGTGYLVEFGDGAISFSKEAMKKVANAPHLKYDEFLEAQYRSLGRQRDYFAQCLYCGGILTAKGKVTLIREDCILFKRLAVEIDTMDGYCTDGKENHVWVFKKHIKEESDLAIFNGLKKGDCVRFDAEVQRYYRQKNKTIDFGLYNIYGLKKIDEYEIPTDEELTEQAARRIVCKTCKFVDHCNGFCIANKEETKERYQAIMESMKQGL